MSEKNNLRRRYSRDESDDEKYATSYFAPSNSDDSGIGYSNFLAAMFRNAGWIIFLTILGGTVGYYVTEMRGPQYVANAVVVLEPENTSLSILEISESLSTNRSTVETQLDVFKSTELLGDVLERIEKRYEGISNAPQIPNLSRDERIKWLSGSTNVGRKGESLALTIVVTASDPILAADLANEIGRTYIDRRVSQKRNEILIAENILKQRTLEVRSQLSNSEKELALLLQSKQLNDLEQDAILRAKAAQLQALIEYLDPETAEDQERLKQLRQQEAEIQRKLIDRIVATIRKEELSREIENSRQRDELMFEQLLRVEAETIIMSPGAQLVSAADAPLKPSGLSSKVSSVLGALSLGFFGALAIIFSAAFDRKLRTPEQLESILNVPCLGAVPLLKKHDEKLEGDDSILNQMKLGKRSIFLTAIFKSFFNLQTQIGKEKGTVIGVTSCTQNEGKSTVAASLAGAASVKKLRVALVDFDMWHQGTDVLASHESTDKNNVPSYASRAKAEAFPSLEDWFNKTKTLDQIKSPASGFEKVDVFPWKISGGDHFKDLDQTRIDAMFEYLRSEYDLVIIDTAPFLLVSETSAISAKVDGFIVVVAWEKITDKMLLKLKKAMGLARVNIIGTIMNNVDPRKQKLYGMGEYSQYYKDEAHYH
jgi:uncharacterized protein involved in exopolysaccharide biosynthesis/cellulose biosynthesis protein BcsQ